MVYFEAIIEALNNDVVLNLPRATLNALVDWMDDHGIDTDDYGMAGYEVWLA